MKWFSWADRAKLAVARDIASETLFRMKDLDCFIFNPVSRCLPKNVFRQDFRGVLSLAKSPCLDAVGLSGERKLTGFLRKIHK